VALVFETLVNSLYQEKDASKRIDGAKAIFGAGGDRMVGLAEGGREAMDAARAEARALMGIVDPETVKAAKEFSDNLDRMKTVLGSLRDAVAQQVLPVLSELTTELTDWLKANRGMLADEIGGFVRGLAETVRGVDWKGVADGCQGVRQAALSPLKDFLGGWGHLAAWAIVAYLAFVPYARSL
jgi:phage-related tail protein